MASTLVRPESSPSALLVASSDDDGDDNRGGWGCRRRSRAGNVLGVVLGRKPTHGETWESSASSNSAAVETVDALTLILMVGRKAESGKVGKWEKHALLPGFMY